MVCCNRLGRARCRYALILGGAAFVLTLLLNGEMVAVTFSGVSRVVTGGSQARTPLDAKDRAVQAMPTIRARFASRLAQLEAGCSVYQKRDAGEKLYQEKRRTLAFGRLDWCPIFKAGFSFMLLSVSANDASHSVNGSYDGETKSVVVVRDPYSRALSAFLDKFISNPVFRKKWGRWIVEKFRPNATAHSKACEDVSFPEFVKYLIHSDRTREMREPHFVPIHQLCQLCHKKYDYVVHLETIKEDVKFMYDSVNVHISNDSFLRPRDEVGDRWSGIVKAYRDTTEVKTCNGSLWSHLVDTWWALQARGLISKDIPFNLSEDECNKLTDEQLGRLARDAEASPPRPFSPRVQKREFLVQMYLKVPLEDRLSLKEVFNNDFQMFGYTALPKDIFPELYRY